jgi:hypothetical protein
MRYRIGSEPGEAASPEGIVFAGAAALGLAVGIGIAVLGWRGRQLWMMAWGTGLVVASLAYLAWAALAG